MIIQRSLIVSFGRWLQKSAAARLFCLIIILQGFFQYWVARYYILYDPTSLADWWVVHAILMGLFWIAGFHYAHMIGTWLPTRWRIASPFAWSLFFTIWIVVWVVNLNILYYSGLHVSPVALEHADGAGKFFQNETSIFSYLIIVLLLAILFKGVRAFFRERLSENEKKQRRWKLAAWNIIFIVTTGMIVILNRTPEWVIATSFYERYFPTKSNVIFSTGLQKKLERFGLFYKPDEFYVSQHERIFDPAAPSLLPAVFQKTPPNILMVFMESFSGRLTSVYNDDYTALTPGLEKIAQNPFTTTIHNYYNSSTPTETGMLSQLCSFLPPTGHGETNVNILKEHKLLCLPEILAQHGYAARGYFTGVKKEYAGKDQIFGNMGVETNGEEEMKKWIDDAPASWGFSDHQMFPAIWRIMQEENARPFFFMTSTIDSHPPFNLSRDATVYRNGKKNVLNAFHSTDDAIKIFWDSFLQSDFAKDTIVVFVADHAAFPAAEVKKLFPDDANALSYYDETVALIYVPDSVLPQSVDMVSSGLDLTPTLLQILNINTANSFEGHSLFFDRANYPNIVGMHELGMYMNQAKPNGERKRSFSNFFDKTLCAEEKNVPETELTMCEFRAFYLWKRQMLEAGRLWKNFN